MLKLLDVLIGLCLVYFLFSVATSAVTEMFTSAIQKRAKLLKQSLLAMLGGVPADMSSGEESTNPLQEKSLAVDFFSHHLVASLAESEKRFASYIPSTTFSQALTDILIRGKAPESAALSWNADKAFKTLTDGIQALPVTSSARQALMALANEGEQNVTAFRKRIHVRCRRHLAAVAARLRPAHVVHVEDEDVRLVRSGQMRQQRGAECEE
mgnify:CR=1 FL=1